MTKSDINFGSLIEHYTKAFIENFHIIPVLGCELEFYTKEQSSIEDLKLALSNQGIKLSKEEGKNQYELQFPHTNQINSLISSIENAKRNLKKLATFESEPYSEEPTSAMHIHLNFLDQEANNIFDRKNGKNPAILGYAVGGLLKTMKESCIFFSPNTGDYARYTKRSMNTPSNISWGVNNRTTAIRITPRESGFRRIEHRLPSANASPEKVIAAILVSTYTGIKEKLIPMEPIYGNAFDSQYKLEKLPQNLKEAQAEFMQGTFHLELTSVTGLQLRL
ncbi:MAG: glutamine synthetase [Gammaproteobacteria bacterium]|nr:glutamine synthetase [Gammaproteobacteria bacterium]MCH9753484.1 glutamine synthetase [Alphaproteobacteria bacterium]